MVPGALTLIWCYPADQADAWFVQGPTRMVAEIHYMQCILQEKYRPPIYRVIAQHKVDQHGETPSYAIN
jgi:hypothetical protein